MSEIEKMYENAGIEKEKKQQCVKSYRTENGIGICIDFNKRDDYLYCYPPFTAEKQLETLCFIVNKKHSVIFHDQSFGDSKFTLEKIQETLALEVNSLWQSLTPEEKQQVKGILE